MSSINPNIGDISAGLLSGYKANEKSTGNPNSHADFNVGNKSYHIDIQDTGNIFLRGINKLFNKDFGVRYDVGILGGKLNAMNAKQLDESEFEKLGKNSNQVDGKEGARASMFAKLAKKATWHGGQGSVDGLTRKEAAKLIKYETLIDVNQKKAAEKKAEGSKYAESPPGRRNEILGNPQTGNQPLPSVNNQPTVNPPSVNKQKPSVSKQSVYKQPPTQYQQPQPGNPVPYQQPPGNQSWSNQPVYQQPPTQYQQPQPGNPVPYQQPPGNQSWSNQSVYNPQQPQQNGYPQTQYPQQNGFPQNSQYLQPPQQGYRQ
jgi:hypothetical protein